MLDFIARAYRGGISAILWITQIGFLVGGGILGWFLKHGAIEFIFIGAVGGAIVGLWLNILFGGFIANFLNIVDNIEKIKNNQNI